VSPARSGIAGINGRCSDSSGRETWRARKGFDEMTLTSESFSVEKWWEKLIERTPVKYISLVLGGFGAALLWRYPAGYFRHSLGEASVIAALLVLLVDPFLKARLLREAARDIFHYLLAFDQQPEIKERLKRLVFDTKLFRKNFSARYTFVPQVDSMRIDLEYDFELVNPTEEAIDFPLKIEFEKAEYPRVDFLTLVSSEKSYKWEPKLEPCKDDPWVLQGFGEAVKIQPASKGVSYRFSGRCSVKYPSSFYYSQHFAYPTIGVTVTISAPESIDVSAAPTRAHEANIWRYEKLFMPGDHVNLRWSPKEPNRRESAGRGSSEAQ
jgi:hypothetical protein